MTGRKIMKEEKKVFMNAMNKILEMWSLTLKQMLKGQLAKCI